MTTEKKAKNRNPALQAASLYAKIIKIDDREAEANRRIGAIRDERAELMSSVTPDVMTHLDRLLGKTTENAKPAATNGTKQITATA
jgi:hypothetical protein